MFKKIFIPYLALFSRVSLATDARAGELPEASSSELLEAFSSEASALRDIRGYRLSGQYSDAISLMLQAKQLCWKVANYDCSRIDDEMAHLSAEVIGQGSLDEAGFKLLVTVLLEVDMSEELKEKSLSRLVLTKENVDNYLAFMERYVSAFRSYNERQVDFTQLVNLLERMINTLDPNVQQIEIVENIVFELIELMEWIPGANKEMMKAQSSHITALLANLIQAGEEKNTVKTGDLTHSFRGRTESLPAFPRIQAVKDTTFNDTEDHYSRITDLGLQMRHGATNFKRKPPFPRPLSPLLSDSGSSPSSSPALDPATFFYRRGLDCYSNKDYPGTFNNFVIASSRGNQSSEFLRMVYTLAEKFYRRATKNKGYFSENIANAKRLCDICKAGNSHLKRQVNKLIQNIALLEKTRSEETNPYTRPETLVLPKIREPAAKSSSVHTSHRRSSSLTALPLIKLTDEAGGSAVGWRDVESGSSRNAQLGSPVQSEDAYQLRRRSASASQMLSSSPPESSDAESGSSRKRLSSQLSSPARSKGASLSDVTVDPSPFSTTLAPPLPSRKYNDEGEDAYQLRRSASQMLSSPPLKSSDVERGSSHKRLSSRLTSPTRSIGTSLNSLTESSPLTPPPPPSLALRDQEENKGGYDHLSPIKHHLVLTKPRSIAVMATRLELAKEHMAEQQYDESKTLLRQLISIKENDIEQNEVFSSQSFYQIQIEAFEVLIRDIILQAGILLPSAKDLEDLKTLLALEFTISDSNRQLYFDAAKLVADDYFYSIRKQLKKNSVELISPSFCDDVKQLELLIEKWKLPLEKKQLETLILILSHYVKNHNAELAFDFFEKIVEKLGLFSGEPILRSRCEFEIAQCHKLVGNYQKALLFYERSKARIPEGVVVRRENDAQTKIEELNNRMLIPGNEAYQKGQYFEEIHVYDQARTHYNEAFELAQQAEGFPSELAKKAYERVDSTMKALEDSSFHGRETMKKHYLDSLEKGCRHPALLDLLQFIIVDYCNEEKYKSANNLISAVLSYRSTLPPDFIGVLDDLWISVGSHLPSLPALPVSSSPALDKKVKKMSTIRRRASQKRKATFHSIDAEALSRAKESPCDKYASLIESVFSSSKRSFRPEQRAVAAYPSVKGMINCCVEGAFPLTEENFSWAMRVLTIFSEQHNLDLTRELADKLQVVLPVDEQVTKKAAINRLVAQCYEYAGDFSNALTYYQLAAPQGNSNDVVRLRKKSSGGEQANQTGIYLREIGLFDLAEENFKKAKGHKEAKANLVRVRSQAAIHAEDPASYWETALSFGFRDHRLFDNLLDYVEEKLIPANDREEAKRILDFISDMSETIPGSYVNAVLSRQSGLIDTIITSEPSEPSEPSEQVGSSNYSPTLFKPQAEKHQYPSNDSDSDGSQALLQTNITLRV